LYGRASIGKTTLAVRWAHQIADRFPDGQLYVNLHGFGPCDAAIAPEDVLADFLTALGAPDDAVPGAAASRVAAYRSRLAGKGRWCCWTTPATPSRSARCCPAPATVWRS
jgi:hypothetical protein